MEKRSKKCEVKSVEGRTISGYAIRFNEESQDMGFIETIAAGAVTDDTIKNSDVFAKLNHRDDVTSARSRYGVGSLKLSIDEEGLYYEFESPNTIWGDELLEHIRRSEITSSSFAFSIAADEDAQEWYKDGDTLKRTIYKIDALYDISPVFEPAYLSTSCSARSKEAEDALAKIEAKRQAKIINNLNEKLGDFLNKINI